MIQLATALLPTAPAAQSTPGAVLSSASDFALALAQLGEPASVVTSAIRVAGNVDAIPSAPALPAATPLPERQAVAARGTILPAEMPMARPTMPTIDVATAVPTIAGPQRSGAAARPNAAVAAAESAVAQPASKLPEQADPTTIDPAAVSIAPLVVDATPSSAEPRECTDEAAEHPADSRSSPKRQSIAMSLAALAPSLADATSALDRTEATVAGPDAVEANERDPDAPGAPPVATTPLVAVPSASPSSIAPGSVARAAGDASVIRGGPAAPTRAAVETPAASTILPDRAAAPLTPAMPSSPSSVARTVVRPDATPARVTSTVAPDPYAAPTSRAAPVAAAAVIPPAPPTEATVPVRASMRAQPEVPVTPVAGAPVTDVPTPSPTSAADIVRPSAPSTSAISEAMRARPAGNAAERVESPVAGTVPQPDASAGQAIAAALQPVVGAQPVAPIVQAVAPTPHPDAEPPPVGRAQPIAEPTIVAAADRVARTLTPVPTVPAPVAQSPFRPGSELRPASAPVTPLRAVAVPSPARTVEQPAGAAFAAQLFAAASTPQGDDASDPIADLTAAFPLAGLTGAAPAPEQVTAPLAAQDVPLDLTDDGWMTGMIDRIETLRDSGGAQVETRIRLTPDALGGIDVAITRDDAGTLQVQLSTDTPQARAVLAEAAPRLADMAEARGLKLGGSAVDAGTGQPGGERRESHQPTPTRPRPASTRADAPSRITDHRIA